MFLSQPSESVVLRALSFVRRFPFRVDEALGLEPVERWIERAGLYLEHVFRQITNLRRDGVAVGRAKDECPQNEQIERALKKVDASLFASHRLCRHSTQTYVDCLQNRCRSPEQSRLQQA